MLVKQECVAVEDGRCPIRGTVRVRDCVAACFERAARRDEVRSISGQCVGESTESWLQCDCGGQRLKAPWVAPFVARS